MTEKEYMEAMEQYDSAREGFDAPISDEELAQKVSVVLAWDTETGHEDADRLIVAQLYLLGYKKAAAAFEAAEKWYA